MSLMDVLLGPECGVDIYEEPNEQTWIDCQVKKARIGMIFSIPIIIVIVIICLFFGSTLFKVGAVFVGFALIALILFSGLYWTPLSAKNNYQRYQKEIKSYMDSGMSRADALREIKSERMARERIAADKSMANQSAASQSAGMFAIASALRSR